ncbi:MAG: hypothetical protein V1793_17160 [Pseudomonadota bacterium]
MRRTVAGSIDIFAPAVLKVVCDWVWAADFKIETLSTGVSAAVTGGGGKISSFGAGINFFAGMAACFRLAAAMRISECMGLRCVTAVLESSIPAFSTARMSFLETGFDTVFSGFTLIPGFSSGDLVLN